MLFKSTVITMIHKNCPTLDAERDYKLTLLDTLARQSQYQKTVSGTPQSSEMTDIFPGGSETGAYRFPPQDGCMHPLQCIIPVQKEDGNVNNLL